MEPIFHCTNCGTTLTAGSTRCHTCGVLTPYQKTERVCINCGTPAAQRVKTCLMCGHTIDALPNRAVDFSVSGPGIIIGLIIIMTLIYWFFQIQPLEVSNAAITETQPTFTPPTNTLTLTITPTPPLAPTLTPTLTPTPAPIIHPVKSGETLLVISQKYGVPLDVLIEANDVTEQTILQIGQEIIIPPLDGQTSNSGNAQPNVPERPSVRYSIESGDTLSSIAAEFDTSVLAIESANPGLNADLLSVGQEIIVPLRPPTFTPTPTVTATPTFTPRPPYQTPYLLSPLENTIVEGDDTTPFLSWTTAGDLGDNIFYVITLTTEDGSTKTYWTNQSTSYHLPAADRPTRLTTYTWSVTVMEQIGVDVNGQFYGKLLSETSEERTFQWR